MLIEVRPGEGGEDAVAFADQLFNTLLMFCQTGGFRPRSVTRSQRILSCEVDGPAETLHELAGTHRVQRIPKGSKSRHTSTATFVVLEDELQPTS